MDEKPGNTRFGGAPTSTILVVLMLSYFGAAYATSGYAPKHGYFCDARTHQIGSHRLPEWIDEFFWLADWVNDRTVLRDD